MSEKSKPIINIILSVVGIGAIIVASNLLPVDLQALLSMALIMVALEGMGLKAVADFQENTNTFMLYIPIIRHYKLGQVMEYAGNPLLGKLNLTFYSIVATTITLIGYYVVSPGLLKAILLVASIVLGILHLVFRTIYYYIITSKLSTVGVALATLLVVPQTLIIVFVFRNKIKELKKYDIEDSDDVEYEDEE